MAHFWPIAAIIPWHPGDGQQIFSYIYVYACMYIHIYIYIYIFISIHYSVDPQSGTQIALSDRLLSSNPLAALFGHSSTQVMKKNLRKNTKGALNSRTPLIDARHINDSYHSRRSWEKRANPRTNLQEKEHTDAKFVFLPACSYHPLRACAAGMSGFISTCT